MNVIAVAAYPPNTALVLPFLFVFAVCALYMPVTLLVKEIGGLYSGNLVPLVAAAPPPIF